ncbi:MAG: hypothetical protein AAGK13_22315, partial [Pseudomonadota bacterium]
MSIIRWYDAPALHNPKGVTLNSNFPRGIAKAVFSLSVSVSGNYQYAEAASRVDQYIVPSIESMTSRMCGNGYESFFVTSFNPLKSHTKRIELSFFFTKMTGAFRG